MAAGGTDIVSIISPPSEISLRSTPAFFKHMAKTIINHKRKYIYLGIRISSQAVGTGSFNYQIFLLIFQRKSIYVDNLTILFNFLDQLYFLIE